jgi:hypothetical protein
MLFYERLLLACIHICLVWACVPHVRALIHTCPCYREDQHPLFACAHVLNVNMYPTCLCPNPHMPLLPKISALKPPSHPRVGGRYTWATSREVTHPELHSSISTLNTSKIEVSHPQITASRAHLNQGFLV